MAAIVKNITLFIPLGCYTVTKTLTAAQPRNGRWQPVVIVGQVPDVQDGGGYRPVLVLPPSTPGFRDSKQATPVLFFVTNWCLEPGADRDAPAKGCNTSAQVQTDNADDSSLSHFL